ncbi:c-type cytochrome [Silicimonas algicola]|uniref:Cytochrome c domain-containing protein n=1 Tax=Silicimonas algicola TaxID=1826607 RepID=A0A316G4D2_9RHOB|nr:cytochrome c [Silicimonas algicola]PWK54640.1 hypothetical protein C8D95_11175 [Silicimonas algicola]
MRLVLLTALLCASPAVAADDHAAALFYGTGDVGATVRLAGGEAELSARLFPCANCHGADGQGSVEGALVVPPIAGRGLSVDDLVRAAEHGMGPDGEALDPAMPRYAFADGGIAELVRFLDALPHRERAGVSGSTVRIAVVGDHAETFLRGLSASVDGERAWGRSIVVDTGAGDDAFLGAGLDGGEQPGLPILSLSDEARLSPEAAGHATGQALIAALRATGRNLTRSRAIAAFREMGGRTVN